ncbi:MAG: InlB B-repeat-containing protein, partial [Oscillospiraceae bacterium]|nr:InlB B-repeat-containing protein [Oscillospiraceae bacterium]
YVGQRYYREYSNSIEYTGQRERYENFTSEYTGIRYKRIESNSKWVLTHTISGLYGQSLSETGQPWPTDYDWFDSHSGSTANGTHTTFLDAFLPTEEGKTLLIFYGKIHSDGRNRVSFWQQTEDLSGYVKKDTVYTTGADFNISNKYTGFEAVKYSLDEGITFNDVGTFNPSTGYYGSAISGYSTLDIYYDRLTNQITYADGAYFKEGLTPLDVTPDGAPLKEVPGINYGADISSYNTFYTPTKEGYVFEGWYVDQPCSTPYTFTTMPIGGVIVYAKWVQVQYRVFLHPGVPEGELVNWGDQEMSFRVNYNESVKGSMIVGIRNDYEIVGWYYDEACTDPFIFDTKLNKQTVPAENVYDTSQTSEVDRLYGLPLGSKREYQGQPDDPDNGKFFIWDDANDTWLLDSNSGKKIPWNKDEYNNRFWVTHEFHLYAKWRSKITGAYGIDVEYYNGDELYYTDPTQYLDQAQAIAYATTPAASAGNEFKYWLVMHWDGSSYSEPESNAQQVLPDAGFTVLKTDASVRDLTAEELSAAPAGVTKKYIIRLKAVFGPIESETKTKLVYDGNGGTIVASPVYPDGMPTPTVNGNVITFEGLTINEEYPQLGEVFTRPGYNFLGWSSNSSSTAPEFAADQLIAPDILNGGVNTLYAVWEEKTITINYVAKGPDGAENFGSVSPTAETNPIKVFSGTASGSNATAGEGFKFVGWYSDENCETLVSENAEFVPQKSGDPAHYPYDSETLTFYAKFEYNTTTLTITNNSGHDAIFTVSGQGYEGLLLAIPSGKSLTIANVYVNEDYTITMDTGWSWRYDSFSKKIENLDPGTNSYTVAAQTMAKTKWLSGTSYAWVYKPTLYVVSD